MSTCRACARRASRKPPPRQTFTAWAIERKGRLLLVYDEGDIALQTSPGLLKAVRIPGVEKVVRVKVTVTPL